MLHCQVVVMFVLTGFTVSIAHSTLMYFYGLNPTGQPVPNEFSSRGLQALITYARSVRPGPLDCIR